MCERTDVVVCRWELWAEARGSVKALIRAVVADYCTSGQWAVAHFPVSGLNQSPFVEAGNYGT